MRPPRLPDASFLDRAELRALRDLVAEDLVDEQGLFDLAGAFDEHEHDDEDAPPTDDGVGAAHRAEIPRVRPILVALAARAAGAAEVDDQAQVVAEMLHWALGAHDMALGRPRSLRRRVARRVIRRSVSWVAGNHLTLRALELSRHGRPELLEELLDTLRAFADASALSRDLVGVVPDEDDWLEHADLHVGALFVYCCRVGARLAGAPEARVATLGRFGRHVGRLWHIAEDVAELEHGDAVAHVIRRAATGRPALPIVHVLAQHPDLHEDWLTLAAEPSARAAQRLVEAMRAHALHRCREAMLQERWRACRALRALPDTRYRRSLEALAVTLSKSGLRPRRA